MRSHSFGMDDMPKRRPTVTRRLSPRRTIRDYLVAVDVLKVALDLPDGGQIVQVTLQTTPKQEKFVVVTTEEGDVG